MHNCDHTKDAGVECNRKLSCLLQLLYNVVIAGDRISFQKKTTAPMVKFNFVEDLVREKAEWRSAFTRHGAPYVAHPGAVMTVMSCVNSCWDINL